MTPGREQSVRLGITVSSGAGSGTFTNIWSIVRWLRVKPIAETDSYTLTISDADGMVMLVRSAQVGTFSERIEMSLGIIRTISIAGATQDGTYQVRCDMH